MCIAFSSHRSLKKDEKYVKVFAREDKYSAIFSGDSKIIQNKLDNKLFHLNKISHTVTHKIIENMSFLLSQIGS